MIKYFERSVGLMRRGAYALSTVTIGVLTLACQGGSPSSPRPKESSTNVAIKPVATAPATLERWPDPPTPLQPSVGEVIGGWSPPDELIELAVNTHLFLTESAGHAYSDGESLIILEESKTEIDQSNGLVVSIQKIDEGSSALQIPILQPDECELLRPAVCSRLIKTRLRRANEILAGHTWRSLTMYAPEPSDSDFCRETGALQELRLPSLRVTLQGFDLLVARNDGALLGTQTVPAGTNGTMAERRPYMKEIGVDFERGLLLIELLYCDYYLHGPPVWVRVLFQLPT